MAMTFKEYEKSSDPPIKWYSECEIEIDQDENGENSCDFTVPKVNYDFKLCKFTKILSRASEVGSPTNHLGSRQRRGDPLVR